MSRASEVPVPAEAARTAIRAAQERGEDVVPLPVLASVHSLRATFAGRDGLLSAVYESRTPLFDIEALLAEPAPNG